MPKEYAEICEHAEATGVPIHVVESERLGVSHAQVGAYLLGLWGLPHEVLDIVLYHHAPWVGRLPLDAASAVHLAEAIALELTPDRSFTATHAVPLPEGWIEQTGVAPVIAAIRAKSKT